MNANHAAYRHKNLDSQFSDRLNGARKCEATEAERTVSDAERAIAAVTEQELPMSQADSLTRVGFGTLGNMLRAGAGVVDWERAIMHDTKNDDDDYLIAAHAFDGDKQVTHVRISNRFGHKILDRWLDLLCTDGQDYPVSPEEMSGLIDREIGEVN